MHPYLRDTEYAAQNLIRLAMDEALHPTMRKLSAFKCR